MTYKQRHLTQSVVMVRPHDFGFNEQTRSDNEFQHQPASISEAISFGKKAMAEFENMADKLISAGIEVLILDKPQKVVALPDAIFPNNWFSCTADGRLFIYPMKTLNRQAEVQLDELQSLLYKHQYRVVEVIDLRKARLSNGKFWRALEGTGSLIFQHKLGVIYATLSDRCNRVELENFAEKYAYELHSFSSRSRGGLPVYHTNVLMSCGDDFAIIADEILVDELNAKATIEHLKNSVTDVISITEQQMAENFCGNILQLTDGNNQPVIILSESAYKGFTRVQIKIIERHGSLIICPIPTIEYVAGGSARCMIAENFLPKM